MREAKRNLWDLDTNPDAICITTNSTIASDGQAVMGGGCALEAATYFPEMPGLLAKHLKENKNVIGAFAVRAPYTLVTFPTKHSVYKDSPLDLILESARDLVRLTDAKQWQVVVLPRPGCGLGGLKWEDVGPELADILDDRFTVVTQ